jgi:4'-phosphopantetheinyl transferase
VRQGDQGNSERRGSGPGTCTVWHASLADLRPEHDALLDEVERARRSAYVQRPDAHRFTLGRVVTRLVMGQVLGVSADEVRLDSTCPRCGAPHGRPWVTSGDAPNLSISHAGELVLVAVSAVGDVGVDIERDVPPGQPEGLDPADPADAADARGLAEAIGMADAMGMAAQMLTPVEQETFRALSPADRPRALLRYWTRKEAVLKATGFGLTLDPATVEVSAPDQPPEVVSWPHVTESADDFTLVDLDVGAGYLACLAVQAPPDVAVRVQDATDLLRSWRAPEPAPPSERS